MNAACLISGIANPSKFHLINKHNNSPKAINYKLFKTSFQAEEYFELLKHKKNHLFLQI